VAEESKYRFTSLRDLKKDVKVNFQSFSLLIATRNFRNSRDGHDYCFLSQKNRRELLKEIYDNIRCSVIDIHQFGFFMDNSSSPFITPWRIKVVITATGATSAVLIIRMTCIEAALVHTPKL
jgi:hypothetical protein